MPARPAIQSVPARDDHVERELTAVVLTQLRDGLALVNSGLSKMNDKMDAISGQVIRIEARDVEKELEQYKADAAKADAIRDTAILALQLALARYQGLFMPLAIFGTSIFTTALALAVTTLTKGHP